jgi:hypothetical protein
MWTNTLAIASQIQLTAGGPLRMGIIYAGGDNKPDSFKSEVVLELAAGGVPGATIVSFN